jgi:transposase InsO family protein
MSANPLVSKSAVARAFGVARSTLYARPRQPEKDKCILREVLTVLEEHPHYGYRRVALALTTNKKPIQRIMKKYGLKPKKRRKHLRKQADEQTLASGIPNRSKQLCPIQPNAVWAGDFTHFAWHRTYLYVATVIDMYTREIIGVTMGLHHSSQLVIAALEDAKQKRDTLPQMFHSDQGSEYASRDCRLWLMAESILPSHSQKAHPWENGRQESFYGKFKQELGNIYRFASLEELMAGIYRQVHYYNTKRIHSSLKMSPRQFHDATLRPRANNKKHRSDGVL